MFMIGQISHLILILLNMSAEEWRETPHSLKQPKRLQHLVLII